MTKIFYTLILLLGVTANPDDNKKKCKINNCYANFNRFHIAGDSAYDDGVDLSSGNNVDCEAKIEVKDEAQKHFCGVFDLHKGFEECSSDKAVVLFGAVHNNAEIRNVIIGDECEFTTTSNLGVGYRGRQRHNTEVQLCFGYNSCKELLSSSAPLMRIMLLSL